MDTFLTFISGLWTALIGWFIISAAKAEAVQARMELQRRSWNPYDWTTWAFAGANPPPPRPEDRAQPGSVIDVSGRRVH